MTREEAIKIIKSECYVFNPFNFDCARMINTALDMAIKALEQESVLDKIIAEIESCREDAEPHLVDYRYYRNEGLDMALDIIDKYKAESEDKE